MSYHLHATLIGLLTTAVATTSLSAPIPDKAPPTNPSNVRLTGWLGSRIDANWKNRLATINLDERLRTFKNPAEGGGWSGEHIGKWLHAACLTWQYTQDDALKARIEEAAATLISCQTPDGYLGTYAKDNRWTGWDVWTHKYNIIGLLSVYDTFGDKKALEAATKIGDLLANTFGEGAGKRDIIRAGEHVGMAATSILEPIVKLYRHTHERRFLDLAKYIVRAYDQTHGPKIVKSLNDSHSVAKTANGKAYEMMSNLVGVCALYRETGDEELLSACRHAYDDIVANQMYISGGTSWGEHFQKPHHLPNAGAASENCAQVTWLQLCSELLQLTGNARYADTLELIVYNHLLASQKTSGDLLCYFTPLQGKKPFDKGCNCCTSSGPRGIALVTTFAYTADDKGITVNFYDESTFEASPSGVKTRLVQQTKYPLDGSVQLLVQPQKPATFELRLRMPGWCRNCRLKVNDVRQVVSAVPGTYQRINREWRAGDKVTIEFDMPARLVRGDHTNEGLVAVQRGPLVLAFDSGLNPDLTFSGVSPLAENDGTVKLAATTRPGVAHAFAATGLKAALDGDAVTIGPVPLVLTSFAEAGQKDAFGVWMPSVERLKKPIGSPFIGAKESYSEPGNLDGSIADGDPTTIRVTFNGKKQSEAWFAVEREKPVKINALIFAHGHWFHDGGWFDASQGKPRLQVKKTRDGKWEDVATITDYPDTTATKTNQLCDAQQFRVKVPEMEVAGIRVIGVPACGDNPEQSFASCGELGGVKEPR